MTRQEQQGQRQQQVVCFRKRYPTLIDDRTVDEDGAPELWCGGGNCGDPEDMGGHYFGAEGYVVAAVVPGVVDAG